MKTKIIYISGDEFFDMTDIRVALKDVRNALGLGHDTVLFAVPVDADNALANNHSINKSALNTDESLQNLEYNPIKCETISTENTSDDFSIKSDTEQVFQNESLVIDETEAPEPVQDIVVPILSVLSTNDSAIEKTAIETTEEIEEVEEITDIDDVKETFSETQIIIDSDAETLENQTTETSPIISSINIDSELNIPDTADNTATVVSISDMINDEVPEKPIEKTLEQLLESMTPLREDNSHLNNINDESQEENNDSFYDINDSDTDATLAQLASEFAQAEDTIPTTQKNETHGKIGKLKNILPFKKAKRDDGGLMGDLFGWAGIAANDDDFSFPGFFTKKQGA